MPNSESSNIDHDEQLRLAWEAAPDFAVLTMDLQGKVQSMNLGAERLLGYSKSELVGLNADVIFTREDLSRGDSDKERRDALEQGRAEDERWHLRKDGSRFWGSGVLTPMPDGRGFIKIMRDLTERRNAEERLRLSEERFRTLATNIPELVFTSHGDGSRTWGSPQWVIFTGLSDLESRTLGWLEAIHPDDRQRTLDAWNDAAGSDRYEVEHRIRRMTDGEFRWHKTRAAPLPATEDLPRDWVGTSSDIHELRTLDQTQKVLLAELQHRTRNLLAMVQSIAKRSARTSRSVPEFVTELQKRLQALSRAESLAPTSTSGSVDIRALVDTELSAHLPATKSEDKVHIEGPPVAIPHTTAQPLSLALHELATNAVKHGALGQESGKLSIVWRVESEDEEDKLALEWRESSVRMPENLDAKREGYGTELITRALPYQLGAETELEFAPDGVCCRVQVPIFENERPGR